MQTSYNCLLRMSDLCQQTAHSLNPVSEECCVQGQSKADVCKGMQPRASMDDLSPELPLNPALQSSRLGSPSFSKARSRGLTETEQGRSEGLPRPALRSISPSWPTSRGRSSRERYNLPVSTSFNQANYTGALGAISHCKLSCPLLSASRQLL